MMPRRLIFLSLVLTLMLTGCFRQASEPFETVEGSQATPADVQPTLQPLASATPEQDTTLEILPTDLLVVTDEPTDLAPIIEPSPTEEISQEDNTGQSSNGQETLPTLGAAVTSTPIVVQPTNTFEPITLPTETPVSQDVTGSNTDPTLTPTFITPGVPAGTGVNPIINTTSAAPNGTPFTATPSGLITPTDFLNPNNIPEQCLYIVRAGDNLFRIALNNSLTLDQLRVANPQVRSDVIQPGDQLILPVAGCDGASVPADSSESTNATPGAQEQIVHIVQSGETLGQIARRYGTTIAAITQANNLPDPNRLSIGQQIIIPQG